MDALTFDQMLPEYQERQKDAARSRMIDESENSAPSPPSPSPSPTSEEAYEADIGGSGTVPVQDEVDSMSSDSASGVSNEGDLATRKSTSSSSSSVQDSNSSLGTSSFFLPSSISPTINYKRDIPQQKLIAVIGRQFDGPDKVADSLQMLVSSPDANSGVSLVKFVPFTLKRKTLLKGVYNGDELKEHDLICMCYNASEARLLLTGTDGYYTSLLKHIESVLGKKLGGGKEREREKGEGGGGKGRVEEEREGGEGDR